MNSVGELRVTVDVDKALSGWAWGVIKEFDKRYPGWFAILDGGLKDERMTESEMEQGYAAAAIAHLQWDDGETDDPDFLIRSDLWDKVSAQPEVAAAQAAYAAALTVCNGDECLDGKSCLHYNPGERCEVYYQHN